MDDVAKIAKQIEEIYQNPKFEITYDAIVDNMRQSLVNKKNSIEVSFRHFYVIK